MSSHEPDTASDIAYRFTNTHWSVVLAARDAASTEGMDALQKLCCAYWLPLYSYIRREGHDRFEAQDLTQDFFARLVSRDYLKRLDPEKGKFRSFLLAYVKNFLAEQRRRSGAQKRGGRHRIISVDACEEGYSLDPVDTLTPDQVFERRWAQTIFQRVLDRLRAEFAARDQSALFEQLQNYQPHEAGGPSYLQIGDRFGMTESAVKSVVQRMRQRHRELLREEVAHTVGTPAEIDEELRHFRDLLSAEPG